jgi:hypothetical protein
MAFNYDLSSSDGDVLTESKSRLQIGDTVENDGPRPDGRNFSQAELLALYSDEGSHVKRAAAAALEILANEWSAYAGNHKLGPESETYQQAAEYRKQAETLRERYGHGDSDQATAVAFGIAVKPAGRD